MLDSLAAADQQLADVIDTIAASRARVSRGTVTALERVLATLRPAADVRARLYGVDLRVLASAIRLRRDRQAGVLRLGEDAACAEGAADAQH